MSKVAELVRRFFSTEAAIRNSSSKLSEKYMAMRISDLEALYLKAKKAYYNGPKAIMTDREFDVLEDTLKKRKPNSKLLKMVGAPVEGKKVKLPYPMSSLSKEKIDTVDRWLGKYPGPYALSDKEDGISLQIVGTKQGTKLYSRGRSNKGNLEESWGKDLSHLVPHLNLPKLADGQALRAEMIISPIKFKKWAKEFENERNLIGGFATRKDVHPAIKDVTIIVYKQLSPVQKPSKYLPALKRAGWQVVPYKIVDSIDGESLSRYYALRKKKSKFSIDGIVIEQDRAVKPSTSDPTHMRAFKENDDAETANVLVTGIEWNVSRHGRVIPTVIIRPVRLSGVTVNRATGWNAKRLLGMGIGKGAIIKIVRSGEVIPHILGVVKKAPKPDKPTFKVEWDENGTNYRLPSSETSDIQTVKGLVHFFKTLSVDHIKIGTAQKLYDAGLDTPVKVIKATEARLAKAIGSTVVATKIKASIKEALASVDHVRLIAASGVFGVGIGNRKAASILKSIPYAKLSKMTVKRMTVEIAKLRGFTEKTAAPFAKAFPDYIKFVDALGVKIAAPATIKPIGSKLKDQVIVFTGIRDADLEGVIAKQGGTVGSGVSSKTTILIAKDPNESSLKLNKARDLGIKIYSPAQFRAKFKL